MLILSFFVGALASCAAQLLKMLIHGIQHLVEHQMIEQHHWLYLITPMIGITLAGLFVKYIVKDDISHGITKILYAISQRKSIIKLHNTWTSVVGSALTIGFGGSVGAEAPIVMTGAAIGSNLAKLFRLDQKTMMLMIGCGAAGAVGGIFQAPIAGLVFTLEVLMMDLTMTRMAPLLISSVTATAISFMVNGQELRTDSVVENAQPTSLPATPTSCSAESNIFVGWTTTPISGTTDIAPKVLYTQAKQIPALKDDLTLYATFAKKQTTQTGQVAATEKLDFSTGYSNGQEVTGKTQGGVTVAFSKASGSNPPKYYTSGNAVRCYPKNTITVTASDITKIAFTFGSGDNSNAITANKGSFSTNTWTGTADEVVFTIGGTSGHRRIAAVEVTMNGVGETTVYSRYITSCQTTTELTEQPMDMRSARKVLIGGQIYLQVADGLYNMLGQKVN